MQKAADSIRFLCADMVQNANSGHPGAPMGMADIMCVLLKHLRHNPKNPHWLNRDRLVFSGGHASALLYSFLYLSGYDISLDDLKNFRQLNSKTPGHPEIETLGVEIATGPLGQGVANAVGFAMAAKRAAYLLNEPNAQIIDHKIYCLCGDGDLQEGISYEACALAGHHALDNLVIIYDSNNITIEGDISIAWSEDIKARFEAQGFEVARINGHNFDEIEFALSEVKNKKKPYLIIANTLIAKGCELQGSHKAHGSPLGEDVIRNAKIKAGFDPDKKFYISDEILARFRTAVEKGDLAQSLWEKELANLSANKQKLLQKLLKPDFADIKYPKFDANLVATRDSNGAILNAISQSLPGFIGGSADLDSSNKTHINQSPDFPFGVNMHYGIREHAMAAINNAFARYGLFVPFSATFFVFSDYLKGAARVAALMKIRHFFVFTHDSIGVGEDGPTHQPIEQLSMLRAMPNFYVFRPADANENVECWKKAFELNAPCAFVCSRQKLEFIPKSVFGEVQNGAYLIKKSKNPMITLVASGSEVALCLKAAEILSSKQISANVVSAPCFDLLCKQDEIYISQIFDKNSKILAVETARALEWYKFADEIFAMNSFGKSAKAKDVFEYFGFSAENIALWAENLLNG